MPWTRLFREWGIFAAVMVLVFTFLKASGGSYVGLLVSLPLYLGFGAVLAKFGYSRKSLREMRAEREAQAAAPVQTSARGPKPKPAPTKRTSTGPQRPSTKSRKR